MISNPYFILSILLPAKLEHLRMNGSLFVFICIFSFYSILVWVIEKSVMKMVSILFGVFLLFLFLGFGFFFSSSSMLLTLNIYLTFSALLVLCFTVVLWVCAGCSLMVILWLIDKEEGSNKPVWLLLTPYICFLLYLAILEILTASPINLDYKSKGMY